MPVFYVKADPTQGVDGSDYSLLVDAGTAEDAIFGFVRYAESEDGFGLDPEDYEIQNVFAVPPSTIRTGDKATEPRPLPWYDEQGAACVRGAGRPSI
ncbi:hypothetical protein [Roseibium sediminis]|uniref:hypothetical protein n=1 Tax=Roseibium sediminis TaxID=1775174 RepID=UPI00123DCCBB|nr:hypothetical protein [Roseibium sediminis]